MSARSMWGALAAAVMFVGCNRGPDPAVGRAAAAKAAEHAREGRDAVDRLAHGLVDVMGKAARELGPAMTEPRDVARVRNKLRDLHLDRTDVGLDLSLYPTWFIAAAGNDGRAVAGDRDPEHDFLPGKDLGAAFPCVRAALQGTAGSCVGELSSGEGQPARVYLVGAQPTRAAEGGAVNGVVLGAVTFGKLAKAVRELLNLRTAHDHAQLYVGFLHGAQVIPSGHDNDVQAAYLVPDSLLPRVPRDAAQRLGAGDGRFTFTFSENDGAMQWGAAATRVPSLSNNDALVVFRTNLR